jgi:hypothetical protein
MADIFAVTQKSTLRIGDASNGVQGSSVTVPDSCSRSRHESLFQRAASHARIEAMNSAIYLDILRKTQK